MANVLITGAGRRSGIAAACARTLAAAGWDVGLSCWLPADHESGLLGDEGEPTELVAELRDLGVRAELVEADLADPAAPAQLFDELEGRLGPFKALVASHCRDVELPLLGQRQAAVAIGDREIMAAFLAGFDHRAAAGDPVVVAHRPALALVPIGTRACASLAGKC